jgi:hypothetical protein
MRTTSATSGIRAAINTAAQISNPQVPQDRSVAMPQLRHISPMRKLAPATNIKVRVMLTIKRRPRDYRRPPIAAAQDHHNSRMSSTAGRSLVTVSVTGEVNAL